MLRLSLQGDREALLQTVTLQQLPTFIIEDDKLTVILGAIKDDFPIDYAILASNDALMYAMAVEGTSLSLLCRHLSLLSSR